MKHQSSRRQQLARAVGGLLLAALAVNTAPWQSLHGVGSAQAATAKAAPGPVPARYQVLAQDLSTSIAQFAVHIDQATPDPSDPVIGAHLLVANANRGPVLLQPSVESQLELPVTIIKLAGGGAVLPHRKCHWG